MTVSITVDSSQIDRFVLQLSGAGNRLQGVVGPIIKRAAQNVKNDLVADFGASRHEGFRKIAGKVRYTEPAGNQHGWSTKIGIDKGGAGSLGNIAVFGTFKGGGTHKHPSFYAEKELPEFQRQVLIAVGALI